MVRAFVRPFAGQADHRLRGLGVGIGSSRGRHEGTADDPFLPAYRSMGRVNFFRYRGGSSPVIADGIHQRFTPQGYLYTGRFGLLAEYAFSSGELRRGAETARLSNRAWQAIGSWVVTGEDASFNGVVPANSFDPRAGTWGAVELALRVDRLNIDSDAFPRFSDPTLSARSARALTGGINWYPNQHLRLILNYEETHFGAAPGGVGRRTERAVISRIQFGL